MMHIMFLLLAWGASLQASFCSFSQYVREEPMQLALSGESFGKTHFILGQPDFYERSGEKQTDRLPISEKSRSTIRTYFSPDDDVKKELVALIDAESEGIYLAVFVVTEPDIARALVRAKKRGVPVSIVTDVGCLKERAHKMNMLCDKGCQVYVYNPPAMNQGSSLMHHKFALFNGQKLVWTGSFNFTKAASRSNQENAVIIADNDTFEKFTSQFKRLKNRSYRYGKSARA